MAQIIAHAVAFVAGFLLGVVFFGGMWWTVRASIFSRWPTCWFLAGLAARLSAAAGGVCFIVQAGWGKLIACGIGFLLSRFVVEKMTELPLEEVDEAADGGEP